MTIKPRPKRKPRRANIVEAMNGIFKPWFPPIGTVDTWSNWKAILRAVDALPMSPADVEFFKSIAGGREPPSRPVSEFVAVAARRTGKDSVISAIAAHTAALFDQQDRLRPGEKAAVLCLATDRDQSRIVFGYIAEFFRRIPQLKAMVVRETKNTLELSNNVEITVATNSFRSIRGKPVVLAILDEAAFWLSETSTSPDMELYQALRPALLTIPGSRIAIISSPYRKAGLLWNRYRHAFGKDDDTTLVIQASLRELNPTISQATIDAEAEADPAAAVSELFGRFRDDIAAFLTIEMIESAVDRDIFARPPQQGVAYHCGVDPSGGVSDSWVTAIAHKDKDGKIVLDALLEIKAPFDPEVAAKQSAALMKSYGITRCTGDKYAAQFVVSAYAKHAIRYTHSERDRSKIYADVLAVFTSGRARLLDTPKGRLVVQYAGLQRETTSMGRDKIDHAPGQKDDLANAASLAMVLASVEKAPTKFFPPPDLGFFPSIGTSFNAGIAADAAYASAPPGGWPIGGAPWESGQ